MTSKTHLAERLKNHNQSHCQRSMQEFIICFRRLWFILNLLHQKVCPSLFSGENTP